MKFRETTARRGLEENSRARDFDFSPVSFPLVLIPRRVKGEIKRKEWKKKNRERDRSKYERGEEEGGGDDDDGIGGTSSFAGCANSDGGARKLRHGSDRRSSWFLHIRARPSALPAIPSRHPRTSIADSSRAFLPDSPNRPNSPEFKLGGTDTGAIHESLNNHAMISARGCWISR